MHKFVALMRRYTHDYTNCQDFSVCDEIMVPEYVLHMGTYDLLGRDSQYKPATQRQFEQFPGLCLTINELVTNGERLCLRFSEHGASVRHAGALAAWSGIALYKWNGEKLTECYVEQDYYSRRIQLATGVPKPVEAPALAPWDVQPRPPNPAAEAVVRKVLESGDLTSCEGIIFDDVWAGGPRQRVLEPDGARIDDLFSCGDRVAFRIEQHGRVADDFADGDLGRLRGSAAVLHMTGLVTVAGDRIAHGRVVRDRLGLYRRLSGNSYRSK